MNKKRFDHIEEQMKAAAESWEPAFDEKAWDQMEQMLDGEKDRKKPVAWWIWLLPLFLVLGTGIYFLNREGRKEKETGRVANIYTNDSISNKAVPAATGSNSTEATSAAKKLNDATINAVQNFTKPTITSAFPPAKAAADNGKHASAKIKDSQKGRLNMSVTGAVASGDEEEKNENVPGNSLPGEEKNKTGLGPKEEDKKIATLLSTTSKEEKKATNETTEKEGGKKKSHQPSKFYFSIAAGIEGNGVAFPGINQFSPRAGFTAGYQLNKNLSIQTGFFAGNKKYVAGKEDYKPKAGSYWTMVDITRVDANCRVFEIPLSLRYDFSPSKKWNSFAVAGLSSYIMDREDYEYNYIRQGTPHYAEATYKGNQHLFSVLRISGGVEKKLSQQFSLSINPGLAIPLAGAGDGQVKLFSTELLLSLKYRPFKKLK